MCSLVPVSVSQQQGFHLDIEDYLVGILQLASELVCNPIKNRFRTPDWLLEVQRTNFRFWIRFQSRYAVNSVILGDYEKPLTISKFVADLNSGFRLLNLKNDSLRKRFDALKYDVKKIEEIVYDISIRGLRTEATGAAAVGGAAAAEAPSAPTAEPAAAEEKQA